MEGSPPHTRGQVIPNAINRPMYGITPAHAGTRCRLPFLSTAYEDHPRTRGDKQNVRFQPVKQCGSPPHTRGQDQVFHTAQVILRITPAHAGTSRICGSAPGHRHGSPPHTRGQVLYPVQILPLARITPAHAGTSRLGKNPSIGQKDHPRTRGDKLAVLV